MASLFSADTFYPEMPCILSADPVSLPTAGVFNCRVELFAHLQIKHSFEKEKSTWEMKLP